MFLLYVVQLLNFNKHEHYVIFKRSKIFSYSHNNNIIIQSLNCIIYANKKGRNFLFLEISNLNQTLLERVVKKIQLPK